MGGGIQFAITGSYIACDEEVDANKDVVPIPDKSYYNRAFFLTPEGGAYYYDKRHLFRMGQETEHFTAGNQRPVILLPGMEYTTVSLLRPSLSGMEPERK